MINLKMQNEEEKVQYVRLVQQPHQQIYVTSNPVRFHCKPKLIDNRSSF